MDGERKEEGRVNGARSGSFYVGATKAEGSYMKAYQGARTQKGKANRKRKFTGPPFTAKKVTPQLLLIPTSPIWEPMK